MAKLFELPVITSKGTAFANPHMFAADRAGVLQDSQHVPGIGSQILNAAYESGMLADSTMPKFPRM